MLGPLGTPLGLAQRKRASPHGEEGSPGFLSVSDSDRRVPAELGRESQASSCLRKGTPLASRVAQGDVLILTQNTHKHIHSHLLKSCNGSQVLWGSFVPKGGACFQARVAILPASTVLIVTITSVSGQVKTD